MSAADGGGANSPMSDHSNNDVIWFGKDFAKGMNCIKEPGYDVTGIVIWLGPTDGRVFVPEWNAKIKIHKNMNLALSTRALQPNDHVNLFVTWCYHYNEWIGYGVRSIMTPGVLVGGTFSCNALGYGSKYCGPTAVQGRGVIIERTP